MPATHDLTFVRSWSGHRLAARRNGSHRSGAHYPRAGKAVCLLTPQIKRLPFGSFYLWRWRVTRSRVFFLTKKSLDPSSAFLPHCVNKNMPALGSIPTRTQLCVRFTPQKQKPAEPVVFVEVEGIEPSSKEGLSAFSSVYSLFQDLSTAVRIKQDNAAPISTSR